MVISLDKIIRYIHEAWELMQEDDIRFSIDIQGETGIGKTESIISYFVNEGFVVHKYNIASIEELGDLIGNPITSYELISPQGVKQFIPDKLLNYYINTLRYTPILGSVRTEYSKPHWYPDPTVIDKPGVLLLDDNNRIAPHFQQAIMELLNKGEYHHLKLPRNWIIVSTSNPEDSTEAYQVRTRDKSQLTRITQYKAKFDVDYWTKWATNKFSESVITFVNIDHALIFQKDNIRSFTQAMYNIRREDLTKDPLQNIDLKNKLEAYLSSELTTIFLAFHANNLNVIPNVDLFFKEDTFEKAVNDFKSIKGNTTIYSFVLSERIFDYCNKYPSYHLVPFIKKIFYSEIISEDIQTALIIKLLRTQETTFAELVTDPKFSDLMV